MFLISQPSPQTRLGQEPRKGFVLDSGIRRISQPSSGGAVFPCRPFGPKVLADGDSKHHRSDRFQPSPAQNGANTQGSARVLSCTHWRYAEYRIYTKCDRLTGLRMWIAAMKLSQTLLNAVASQNVWVNDLLWHGIIPEIPSPLSTSASFSRQEYQVTSAILQPGSSHTRFTAACQSNRFPHCSCWPIFSMSRLGWTL